MTKSEKYMVQLYTYTHTHTVQFRCYKNKRGNAHIYTSIEKSHKMPTLYHAEAFAYFYFLPCSFPYFQSSVYGDVHYFYSLQKTKHY